MLFSRAQQQNSDSEIDALNAEFEQVIAERSATINAQYAEYLRNLEQEYVAAGNYQGAAMVVAELEQILGQPIVPDAAEVQLPADKTLRLTATDAILDGLHLEGEGILGWNQEENARWYFTPLPQGAYQVRLYGKALEKQTITVRIEEPFYFLESTREVEAGEELMWDLGYLRIRQASNALQLKIDTRGAAFLVEKVHLFAP